MDLLKLGAVVFFAYTLGGHLGQFVINKVDDDASHEKMMGARWAGRAVTFVALGYVASKI